MVDDVRGLRLASAHERIEEQALLGCLVKLDLETFDERDMPLEDHRELLAVHESQVRQRRGLVDDLLAESGNRKEEPSSALDLGLHLPGERSQISDRRLSLPPSRLEQVVEATEREEAIRLLDGALPVRRLIQDVVELEERLQKVLEVVAALLRSVRIGASAMYRAWSSPSPLERAAISSCFC